MKLSNSVSLPFRSPAKENNESHIVNHLTRQRWQEEWGKYIHERNLWQRVAFLSLSANILLILGISWIGAQSRIVPYVVQVDKLGATNVVQRADTPMTLNAASIKAHLAQWVENTRSVYTDVAAEKKAVNQAYASVNNNSPASALLNEFFTQNEPFKKAESEAVTVQVESVQPISDKTWRIEWKEDHRDRNGGLISHKEMQATATIVINPPTDEPTILVNPLGIYLESFSWSERI